MFTMWPFTEKCLPAPALEGYIASSFQSNLLPGNVSSLLVLVICCLWEPVLSQLADDENAVIYHNTNLRIKSRTKMKPTVDESCLLVQAKWNIWQQSPGVLGALLLIASSSHWAVQC
uniref:Uncharacterized protein n=1 Tax=Mandrillus leucophaeus TaxID=9568 RepID=A0A2K5ZAK0_MANLE